MFRAIAVTVTLLLAASSANAHFVFVVPDADRKYAKVILSETLQPDTDVPVDVIAGAKLTFTDKAGHDSTLKLRKADHAFNIDIPTTEPAVIHGVDELGVTTRVSAKPCLLTYYPKTILGDPFDPAMRLAEPAPVELVPIGEPGKLTFQLLVATKPVPNVEMDIILPDGTDQKVTTDKDGNTSSFKTSGRYGAWARHVEATAGESNGKHYDEARQYATLVIDVPAAKAVSTYAPMPQAASSFGAVACDGWLYIYGGHTADTHSYSTKSVSGQFHRLNLTDHKTWEELPGGPPLQGLNLATWHGKIYRVGGMNARNKEGEEADVRSVADCACFDPATKTWTALPFLPDPRSSHDVVVVGDKLIVVGGWNLGGDPDDAHWLDTTLILDLSSNKLQWTPVKQPFQRRALIAASYQNKVYVIGGFQTESEPTRTVDIYDPATNLWSAGPQLPCPDQNGFGPAACTLDGKLFVSVANGSLYRLNQTANGWDKIAIATATPRIVHRLAPDGSELLVIGGAAKKKQLSLIEAITITEPKSDDAEKH